MTTEIATTKAFITAAIAQLKAANHPDAHNLSLDLRRSGSDMRELLMTRDDAERLLEQLNTTDDANTSALHA
jgi:hypothetical protein